MIDFNYTARGSKKNPAILFLHGFMGSSADWDVIITGLEDDFFCLALDLPGHGKTKTPEIDESQLMKILVEEIPRFLIKIGIKESYLIGYSMGGRLALQMAFNESFNWKGIVLESASPGIRDPEQRNERLQNDLKIADELENNNFEFFLEDWYRQSIFGSISEKSGFDKLLNQRKKNDPLQLAWALRGMTVGRQQSLWRELKNLSIPVLFICGGSDSKYTNIGRQITHTNPDISFEKIKNVGHNVHFQHPIKYIIHIRKFISDQN